MFRKTVKRLIEKDDSVKKGRFKKRDGMNRSVKKNAGDCRRSQEKALMKSCFMRAYAAIE